MNIQRSYFIFIIVFAVIFQGAVIAYVYLNFNRIVPVLMPDDAFYYLKIAENISQGYGSVFSIGEPTNGYHPLWLYCLSAIHYVLKPSREVFVLLVLAASSVVYIATAYPLYKYLKLYKLSDQQVLLGIVLYLFLPWIVNMNFSGLETPLFYFFLFSFLYQFKFIISGNDNLRGYILLGVFAGLLMLSRTDAILFTVPLFLYLAYIKRTTLFTTLLPASITASILLTPWLLWNWIRFGTIVQSSGVAMALIAHNSLPFKMSDMRYFMACKDRLLDTLYRLFVPIFYPHPKYGTFIFPNYRGVIYSILILLGVYFIIYKIVYKKYLIPLPLLIPSILTIFFYICIRTFVQVWHISVILILLIFVVINSLPGRLNLHIISVVMVLLSVISFYSLKYSYYYPQSGLIKHVKSVYPDKIMKIGITDAGYFGYFTHHQVTNLDGVVNNHALKYIQAGVLDHYIKKNNFDIVIADKERLKYYNRNVNGIE